MYYKHWPLGLKLILIAKLAWTATQALPPLNRLIAIIRLSRSFEGILFNYFALNSALNCRNAPAHANDSSSKLSGHISSFTTPRAVVHHTTFAKQLLKQ